MENKTLIVHTHKVSQKLPPLDPDTKMSKFVPVIDEEGEVMIFRLTEYGWNMRDAHANNTPNDNKKPVYWLEIKEITLPEGV